MKIKVNSNKSKRGFTIVELVVALAIILTMSFAAISTIDFQNRVYRNTLQTTEATNLAENAVECFRFAVDNPGEYTGTSELERIQNTFNALYARTVDISNDESTGNFNYNGMNIVITISAVGETSEGTAVTYALYFKATYEGEIVLEESYTK